MIYMICLMGNLYGTIGEDDLDEISDLDENVEEVYLDDGVKNLKKI